MGEQYVTFSAAWFTLSLLNAGLAQAKGHSGLPYWLLSLFFGPIVTLAIVIIPVRRPGEAAYPPGTMSRRQAVLVALAIGIVVLAILGVFALAGGDGGVVTGP